MSGGTLTFPANTTTVFKQANAPTGWTKNTSYDEYTLRIVSGTATQGGSVNFSTVHASGQVWTGSISGGGGTGSTGAATAASSNHSHFGSSWGSPFNPLWFNVAGGPVPGSLQFYNNMSSYQTAPAGGSLSHSHPLSIGSGTFSGGPRASVALQYVDCILASID